MENDTVYLKERNQKMIKFENTKVYNFEGAIRGMRNPMNSWELSDSTHGVCGFKLGKADLKLCQKLIDGGPVHSKFLRQIFISVDITAPLYWWKEFDTYKVGTVANSCSTMHKIHSKKFDFDDFSTDHMSFETLDCMDYIINHLNHCRNKFIETKDKYYWWQMIQLLPTSHNQRRTITLDYEVLRNIIKWRKNHKLDEWSKGFMNWLDGLPYSDELLKYGIEG